MDTTPPFRYVTDTKRVTGHATRLSLETGYRLSGLVDGEGCFSIERRAKGTYVCSFKMKMRSDDRPLLERFRDETGLGTITQGKPWLEDGANRQSWVLWCVQKKSDLLKLTEVFDTYTPISKKRRDYEVWREAVIDWAARGPGDSWTSMAEADKNLREVRKFRKVPQWESVHAPLSGIRHHPGHRTGHYLVC